ncbi:hypothetical protein EDD21DRAFT_377789 [Dissophora ornata]|nr:hypothetical protein EDD21DRAFT_377789 [Dissophora ornata]
MLTSIVFLRLPQGLGGTISVFSIDPRSSNFKLVQSSVFTPAPLFLPNQSVASLNSKIVIYGGFSQDAGLINSVHIFDVIAGTWYGPGLVDPTAVGSSPKAGGLSGAVIGGIAAALVVLIAVMGAAVWRIRRSRARKREEVLRGEISHGSGGGSSGSMQGDRDLPDNNDTIIRLQDMESKSQTNGDSDHAEQQLQQKQLQHKKEPASESSITLADAAMTASTTAPNTPKSTRQHAQGSNTKSSGSSTRRSSRPGQPSRQPSAHSMRSAGSGRVSLFPAGSNIYLVNSPSMLPPTPTVPSVYTMNAIDNSQSTQRHDDSPSNATSPKDDSPSAVTSPNANNKKGHVYKVNVPDAYDDRQPLHRRDTAATMVVPMDERSLMHQPISISAGSTSSPRSVNASWTTGQDPLGERSPRQLKPRSHRKSFSGGRDDASPKIPRLTSSTSIPSSPLSQQLALGENASATVTVTDANRSSQQSKKKKPYQRSKMDHADLSATHGDSGSYKNPTSPRQRQYQLQQQQQGTPSYINPAPATASVSPALSDPDAHFAEAFPLPPKLKNPRSPPSSPRRSSSERNKAQQEQYMDWYQQQQQIQVENQERLSPKTPKLRTVPRSTPKIVNK